METTPDTKSTIALFDNANSQLQNTVTTTGYAFSPVMNNLHQWREPTISVTTAETPHPPSTTSLCWHPRSGLHKCSASSDECQGVPFVTHGGRLHTFASYALPCQMPFCQSAPLPPSVTRQQNWMECWQEGSSSTATQPTSASDVMDQHNKIGGIAFGAALIYNYRLQTIFCLHLEKEDEEDWKDFWDFCYSMFKGVFLLSPVAVTDISSITPTQFLRQ